MIRDLSKKSTNSLYEITSRQSQPLPRDRIDHKLKVFWNGGPLANSLRDSSNPLQLLERNSYFEHILNAHVWINVPDRLSAVELALITISCLAYVLRNTFVEICHLPHITGGAKISSKRWMNFFYLGDLLHGYLPNFLLRAKTRTVRELIPQV